ncbi:Beta-barrel assembly-enhancing protease [bacterium HR17]|uniref:Beta-barrel assembly-enhancing protease n=1 Tax=Candidatus Fervidibacter japonicus TaxID=2035412 RepID=A0A2H5XBK8_9BACT|nr:Beta-barrel assembly-enhancing protease [bacterium HR17]
MRNYLVAVCLLLPIAIGWGRQAVPSDVTPEERRLGEEAVKEFEAKVKPVADHPALPQLRAIVSRLVPVTERPKMAYTIKVVDDPEPNAFTFPGGFMYVTTGLLKLAQSEHELAAVLAHEIAHNTRLHALRMARKESQLSLPVLLSMLAAVFARGEATAQAAQIVSGVVQVMLLGYSRDMEREADEAAFRYLRQAGYNPVGLLTFFEKLAQLERRTTPPQFLPGYWTTHPAVEERIGAIKGWLQAAGLPINRRPVTGALKVEAQEMEVNGQKVGVLLLSGEELCRFAAAEGKTGLARAQEAARRLDAALDDGAQPFAFRLTVAKQRLTVAVNRQVLWELSDDDARLNRRSLDDLAKHIQQALTRAFLRGRLEGQI